MIVFQIALAFASLSFASTDTMPGFDLPSFWRRAYNIPHSYCHHRLIAETTDIGTSATSAISCPLDNREVGSGDIYAICRLSGEKVEVSIAALKRVTKVIFEKKDCSVAPEYPELSYKSRHLEEEYKALSLSSATTPGLMGLYDAQMKTLDILQSKQERAKTPTLEVYVSTSSHCSGPQCEAFLHSRWEASRDWQEEMRLTHDGFKPWNRSIWPACLQVQAIRVFLDLKEDSSEAAEVKRMIRELGEPYSEPGCSRTGAPIYMVFSRKPLRKVEKATLELPGLQDWARNKSREANTKTDDERGKILDHELKISDLSGAPHLKALAIAERDRVRDSAEVIRRLNSGVLVVVSFEGR